MRLSSYYHISNVAKFKNQFIAWCKNHDSVFILDSNDYQTKNNSAVNYPDYEFIAATGINREIKISCPYTLQSLKKELDQKPDWWFGFISYDVKNEIEDLASANDDFIDFPDLYFFQPEHVFTIQGNELEIKYLKNTKTSLIPDQIVESIQNINLQLTYIPPELTIDHKFTKKEYIEIVNKLLDHIQLGDIYEINFCQEFFARNILIDPYYLYKELNNVSPTPFSCFVKNDAKFLISASPERFIKKIGDKIISQPIKGTIKRGKTQTEDIELFHQLKNSKKDIAENTMIVDLVRNDLSKIAKKASVKVEELCGIYSYEQVHQMVSTISAEIKEDIYFVDIIRATFPMGSMTGAPKIKAMELIEKYERTKRGLYSGSVGYIDPEGNFDFNVIIRSILYNQNSKYLSYIVGGAITSLSDPEKEYEECLLKAKAIQKVLCNEG